MGAVGEFVGLGRGSRWRGNCYFLLLQAKQLRIFCLSENVFQNVRKLYFYLFATELKEISLYFSLLDFSVWLCSKFSSNFCCPSFSLSNFFTDCRNSFKSFGIGGAIILAIVVLIIF